MKGVILVNYVTYTDLFAIGTFILSLISLILQILKDKK
ncbi:hypothetical protein [Butyricicoccus porcorum]